MAILEAEADHRVRLNAQLQETLGLLTSETPLRADLGQMGFVEDREVFDRLRILLSRVSDILQPVLPSLPIQEVNALNGSLREAAAPLKKAVQFKPLRNAAENPMVERDAIVRELNTVYHGVFQASLPVLVCASSNALNPFVTDARAALERARTEQTAIEKIKAEADNTLKEMKLVAAEGAVARHAVLFSRQATQHQRAAWIWCSAASVLGANVLWLAFSTLKELGTLLGMKDSSSVVALGVSRVVGISALYIAALWAARLAKAHWHNRIVNQHRQNALGTFETFVGATTDASTRNALLIQAAQAIFAPQATGLVPQEAEPNLPPIVELVRTVTSGKP